MSRVQKILAIFTIVAVVIAQVFLPLRAYALETLDGIYYDAESYAYAKIYAHALMKCKDKVDIGANSKASDIVSGGSFWEIWDIFNWLGVTVEGYWLEDGFPTDDDNGYIICAGEDDGKGIVTAANKAFNTTTLELVCDFENPDRPGLFRSKAGDQSSCQSASDLEFVSNSEAEVYLQKLLKAKVMIYGDDGTGYSIYDFSDAERYYLYLHTFMSGECSNYFAIRTEKPSNDIESEYIVTGFGQDGSNVKSYIVSTGKNGKDLISAQNDVYENHVWEDHNGKHSDRDYDLRCLDLVDAMKSNSAETKSARKLFQIRVVDACNQAFTEALEDKRKRLAEYENLEDVDQEDIVKLRQEIVDEEKITKPWNIDDESGAVSCSVPNFTPPQIVSSFQKADVDYDECYGNSGSLGWIVCPVITWLGDTLNTMYTKMVEPFLVVNSELVSATNSSGEESATHKVWEIFRNFANGAFIILFLVVIFSQLTGVGIDNYGIKKILPKLIVAAILINLSYVICQLAVDVSNIAGSGLNSMFTGIANEVPMTFNGDFNSGTWFAGLLNGLLVVLGIGAGAALVGAAVESGLLAGIILPLLMGLLVAFIAVIFFFALLGLRKAGVVVLVAISPLAFACYMLPNTKKLFDKWLKVFEGLLLLYPICGLLIGGSVLTSRMLVGANEGDFLVYLIGLLLMVVPFFFVPVLLKGSFAAMGNIGAKISSLGNRFGRGLAGRADKGIRNSETFRRMDNAMGRHSVFKRRRAAAVAGTAAMMKERSNRDRLGDRRNMQTRISAIAAAEEAKATDEQTAQRLSLMMSSGSQGGIVMRNGTRTAYTLSNLEARMKELRTDAEGRALTASEQVELSALARGMAGMKGGAGKIGKIIRGAEVTDPTTGAKSVNSNFMAAMGEIYTRDATVQNKLGEKDVGASVFTEQFMPGGKGLKSPAAIGTFAAYQGTTDYQNALNGRIKSYEVGLNQGGDAVDDYIATLTAADCQTIMDNETLFNSLDTDVRQKFVTHAGTFGVTGRSARAVTGTVTVGNPVLNVQGSVDANVTNPVLDVQGTVNVGNEVDVNIRQSRGGQVQPVQTQPQILPRRKK